MEPTSHTRLRVTKLTPNTLVLQQLDGSNFFTASNGSIVIGISRLTEIIKFLVDHCLLDYRVLEGILEEYHSDKGAIHGKD